jgi:hypothetical protein
MASPLSAFRLDHTTVYAVGEEMPATGDAAAVAVLTAKHMPLNGGKGVNVVFPALPINLYATLGQIAARWPILELYIDEMTKLLTAVTGETRICEIFTMLSGG